jgi:hypothetical protein
MRLEENTIEINKSKDIINLPSIAVITAPVDTPDI